MVLFRVRLPQYLSGMTLDKQSEARRKALRRLLRDDLERVDVAAADLRWLLDEVGRLQQGNDRLRRQNRRLRLRGGMADQLDDGGEGDGANGDGADDGARDVDGEAP